jgi:hypothetical protein
MDHLAAYWDSIRQWLWVSPWWHAALVIVPPVALSTLLALRELHHSKEANHLRKEANRIQDELNILQARRNESLVKIADNTAKTATTAERNAARLRKYLGQIAYVTEGGSNWGAMGWLIAEVNEDNILQLFTPVGCQSSGATGICVECDKPSAVTQNRPMRVT